MAETNILYEDEDSNMYCFTCAVVTICTNHGMQINPKTEVYNFHKCHVCQRFLNDKIEI